MDFFPRRRESPPLNFFNPTVAGRSTCLTASCMAVVTVDCLRAQSFAPRGSHPLGTSVFTLSSVVFRAAASAAFLAALMAASSGPDGALQQRKVVVAVLWRRSSFFCAFLISLRRVFFREIMFTGVPGWMFCRQRSSSVGQWMAMPVFFRCWPSRCLFGSRHCCDPFVRHREEADTSCQVFRRLRTNVSF
ncbi:hypothetical protein MKEN_01392300 [Mycena kentingensis (nom. inval.)]|nr:hypothetical protein MKEN_01392300 [Mycena kentingensis (nom. inval.)]